MATTSFDKRPQVMMVNPKTYATGVPTSTSVITLGFNTDLDVNYLDGNFRLQNRDGVIFPISVTYDARIVTLTLLQSLNPNTQYQVLVFGDSNVTDTKAVGVRNVFGTPMAGIYETSFETETLDTILAPDNLSPSDQVTVKEKPTFKWGAIAEAARYEIIVSKFNQMEPAIWPTPGTTYAETEVLPNIILDDGRYFWRVRAIGADGRKGDWSSIHTFELDTAIESPVAEEDTVPNDDFFDPFIDDMTTEVVETFPILNKSGVKTNLKTVYIRVLGEVTAEDVSVKMTGEHATGEDEDHGTVNGTVELFPQDDGTTIIAFTPEVLPEEI